MKLFGFNITRGSDDGTIPSPVTADESQSAVNVDGSDSFVTPYGFAVDLEQKTRGIQDAINKYRSVSSIPEVDKAIEEIVNDMFVIDGSTTPISLSLAEVDISENVANELYESFKEIMNMLKFSQQGHSIGRRWYIDGRIYYYQVVDPNNPSEGIQDLRFIDPRKIQRVRKVKTERDENGFEFDRVVSEYYLFNEEGVGAGKSAGGKQSKDMPIAKDSIAYSDSGLFDPSANMAISHLHKAIKTANSLQRLEDSVVVYRLARAPERRIFYVDVGNMQKERAKQYVDQIASKYKTRIVYDVNTGNVKDKSRHMSMTEDYWLPRREGSRGTEIDTLKGGENLGEIEDVAYFRDKLYMALNVPKGRMDPETGAFNRATEVTREELKFSKFIQRLRANFNDLFVTILGTQVVLKGIMSPDEWDEISRNIQFNYNDDSSISESFQAEIIETRMSMMRDVTDYVGTYYSRDWVAKNVLQMTEEDIKYEKEQIQKEGSDQEDDSGGMGF